MFGQNQNGGAGRARQSAWLMTSCAAVALMGATAAQAQDQATEVDEIVVTGSYERLSLIHI